MHLLWLVHFNSLDSLMTHEARHDNDAPVVILSAYQCGPGMGSVSQLGWEWYSRLAARIPLTLVTHTRNRAALEKAGAPLKDTDIIYVDTEWFAGPLYRLARWLFRRSEHPVFLVSSLDYFLYDRIALRRLVSLQQQGHGWQLVHQPTPVSPLAATTLHRLRLPVILGPWNGGLKSPATFPEIMQAESGWLYPIRYLGGLIERFHGTMRRARLILTATTATYETIPVAYRSKCCQMLENGVDLSVFQPLAWPPAPSAQTPLSILFVGRLLPFKGVAMLLEAVARIAVSHPVRLHIVGTGSEADALKAQADHLNLGNVVHFHGALGHHEIATLMQSVHVFCLPSVRESGGAVLLEAMAAARPVIAIDYGGPAEIVDESVGALIPATGWTQVVDGLCSQLEDVVARPSIWRQRGIAGRTRVEQKFSWPAKIEAALALYQDCMVSV